MHLSGPIVISPSLKASIRIGNAFVCIDYDGEDRDGRTRYQYQIIIPDHPDCVGTDLRSGCSGGDLRSGLESLLTFLAAAGESYRYAMSRKGEGENLDMFPDHVNEWAYQNADELSMLEMEIAENPDCIIE